MLLKIKRAQGGENAYTKKRRRRTIRTIIIIVVVILLLFLGLGLFYTWYMGQNEPVEVESLEVTKPINALPEASKPNENTPIGIGLQYFTSPVIRGQNSSIGIRTTPTAACSIDVDYDGPRSKDTGLIPKVADEFGSVEWTWTVEASRPPGTFPVEIICAYNNRSAYYKADLVINRAE